MARGSYDDMNGERVSNRGGSSTKILLIVILMSILICIIAVLLWVKILESQEKLSAAEATPAPAATESVAQTPPVQQEAKTEAVEQASAETPAVTDTTPDLSIESGISALSSSSGMETDYITSADYAISDVSEDAEVTEESVEMKKPVIAQNLSISQQSFAKDIVRYQEYRIQEGDTLISIADSFGLSVQTLVAVNQIKSTMDLWIGSILQIPDRDGTLYIVSEGDTLLSITQQMGDRTVRNKSISRETTFPCAIRKPRRLLTVGSSI